MFLLLNIETGYVNIYVILGVPKPEFYQLFLPLLIAVPCIGF